MQSRRPIFPLHLRHRCLRFDARCSAISNSFAVESKSWKKGKSLSAGAGGAVKQDVYIQPRLELGIGDRDVILEKVTITKSSAGTDREALYGNLGQDVVANFDRFTIDFSNMVFYLGDPLPSATEKP